MGGRWVYFLSIASCGCATPGGAVEGWKLKNIHNGLLKVQIKEEEIYIIVRVIFIVPLVTLPNFNLLNTIENILFKTQASQLL